MASARDAAPESSGKAPDLDGAAKEKQKSAIAAASQSRAEHTLTAVRREFDRETARLRAQLEVVTLALARSRYERSSTQSAGTASALAASLRIVAREPRLLAASTYWFATGKLRDKLRQQQQMNEVRDTGLFDDAYYTITYPDVQGDGLEHYFRHGVTDGRRPNAFFDTRFYLERYPDVAESGVNPLWHFATRGAAECRNPSPEFDTAFYVANNPGVLRSGLNPLTHYLQLGRQLGLPAVPTESERSPDMPTIAERLDRVAVPIAPKSQSPKLSRLGWWLVSGQLGKRKREWQIRESILAAKLFDEAFYLRTNPDVAGAKLDPLTHFIRHGAGEKRAPHPLFDIRFYLKNNPDVDATGINPLEHFIRYGGLEGRDPHPLFSSKYYLEATPDAAAAGLNPLTHYITVGVHEGRNPHPLFDTMFYVSSYPDVALGSLDPLSHYTLYGATEGYDPNPDFSSAFYLSRHPDVAGSGMNPLVHYANARESESRATQPSRHGPGASTDESLLSVGASAATHEEAWGSYGMLVAKLARARRIALETYQPTAPALCAVKSADEATARALVFPTVKSPRVSIIVPVYNHIKTTLECLASIVAHTASADYEVIVIDDCSSDETSTLLRMIKGLRYLRNDENLGFLRTCNRAAADAKGELLVFLNNDAQVTEGWLEPLIAPFKDPSIGAVGPKIIYPNGRLQEAGAMINADLSITMVGVGEDPSRGQYNYAREVHYCSGTCLAVRRADFEELGGFDDALAPSYYEDCDLQLRLRQKGSRTLYNPASVVAHHLSLTHDGLPELGATKKKQIIVNSQRMREKWASVVEELNDIRLIALYLPQFHPFPENDLWWGKGFTEWTNVTKARPNFIGHYQPQLPVETGFYDLRVPEVMDFQATLARDHGVHGFCYYYYWFGGQRLLELPLERQLETGKPDFPFCLAWANENWTRRWDGGAGQSDILIAQNHSADDDRAMFRDIARYMRRPNYIRINGKPVFLVYRVGLLPDPARTAAIWREVAREEGIGDIYLVRMDSFEFAISTEPPAAMGLDAAVEFMPHHREAELERPIEYVNPSFTGSVYDYEKLVEQSVRYKGAAYTHFRCVMPGWDNTARRQDNAVTFTKSSPGAYQALLEETIRYTHAQNVGDERLIFVNAWNEWAEGAHLEPDRRFGRGFLEATRNALQNHRLGRVK